MRTGEEYFNDVLSWLPSALQRPGMFAGAHCVQGFFGGILRDLLWLEERNKEEFDPVKDVLRANHGVVHDQFTCQGLTSNSRFYNEVASVYAQAAYLLGYFSPRRVLSIPEFESMQSALDEPFFQVDHTRTELEKRFGLPSYIIGSQETYRHSGYACVDKARYWIYFDFVEQLPGWKSPKFPDAMLRDIRRRRQHFEFLPIASHWLKPWPPKPADEEDDDDERQDSTTDEIYVNNLPVPAALVAAIRSGVWRTPKDRRAWRTLFRDREIVRPELYSVEGMQGESRWLLASAGVEFLGERNDNFDPGYIDPINAVVIADLGPDRLIALDYRESVSKPTVIALTSDRHSCWVQVADDIESFMRSIGLID